jgi:membrane fusion protein, hemolysin D
MVNSGTNGNCLPVKSPASASVKPPGSTSKPWKHETKDHGFLPPAVEILQTPPSRAAILSMLFICIALVFALACSYFIRIHIYAVAQGKIQVSGRSKVLQPLEAGKIVTINVHNGTHVNAGDVLLELDPTETSADREAQARDLHASRAEAVRRKVAISLARNNSLKPAPIEFPAEIEQSIRIREAELLAADTGNLASNLASLRAQLAEKAAGRERLLLSIASRENLVSLAKERVDIRQTISDKGWSGRGYVLDVLMEYETHATALVGERAQLVETEAAAHSIEAKIEETVAQFIAEQTNKLAEAERKADQVEQDLIKAQSKNGRTQLRAPISGAVQQLNVTTVGQVVSSGQTLLTVVPLEGSIEIEAMIANQDIGFVEPGQSATIEIEAFPVGRYGAIDGRVIKVSRDGVSERDAMNLSDDANLAEAAKSQIPPQTKPSRMQNLFFPATLTLDRTSMNIDGQEVQLRPGMAVSVGIRTGSRRVIDFVLSPLREVVSK